MELNAYQQQSAKTDRLPDDDLSLPLLGLSGEVGQLLAEYKKRRRDGIGYRAFEHEVREELGDILWYAAALARRTGLDLNDVAQRNLLKTDELFRLGTRHEDWEPFDSDLPPEQQLPRELTITFEESEEMSPAGDSLLRVRMYRGDSVVGDPLDDNSEHADSYRYHDVFHLAHMAVLGWSPLMRDLLGCKRRARPTTDRIQDGGRAIAIEEGLTAYVFTMAADHSYFANSQEVPPGILKVCKRMTAHLEVSKRDYADWHRAILVGYNAFRDVSENRGGVLVANMHEGTLTYRLAS